MRFLMLLPWLFVAGLACADDKDEDYTPKGWREEEIRLPAPPIEANALAFYVSASTENRYFIDSQSIIVGKDGIIRYTLTVLAGGGARNVTYEGIRCETRERRVFASARLDGSWSKFKQSEWTKILDSAKNRHHAALFLEYFCPNGVAVSAPGEAIQLLKTGGYTPGNLP